MTDEKILAEIFEKSDKIETNADLISLVKALEISTENSARLIDLEGKVRVAGTQGGESVTSVSRLVI